MHFLPVQVQLLKSTSAMGDILIKPGDLTELFKGEFENLVSALCPVFDHPVSVTSGMVGSPQAGSAGDAGAVMHRPEHLFVTSHLHSCWAFAADHAAQSSLLRRGWEYVVPASAVETVLLEDLVGVGGHNFRNMVITRNR